MKINILAIILLILAPGIVDASQAVFSGEIALTSPLTFTPGQSATVTIFIKSTSGSGNVYIEADSWPSGWSVSPKNHNPTINQGVYYAQYFTVTPPVGGGSGTITWKLYDDDYGIHPSGSHLIVTRNQTVNAPYDTTVPSTPGTPDLAAADDTGSSSSDNITKKTSGLTFSWSSSSDSGSGLAGYEYKLDSGSWSANSDTDVNISAGHGSHTFYVRAKDNAGNYSNSKSLSFTVDTVAPNAPSIIYPSVNQRITDTTPAFDWSGSDNSGGSGIWKYHLLVETDTLGQNRIDEYPTTSSYNTPSSQALDAGGAGYDWELWAYDIAGNVSSGTGEKRFYIDDPPDTTRPSSPGAPDLRASSDLGSSNTDNITKDSTPTFDWSAATDNKEVTGYEYRINGGSWVNRGNNLNVTLPSQANGLRTLEVRAYDTAGNRSLTPSSLAFTVDTVAPNLPSIIYPSVNQRITDTTPAFDWSGSDNSGGSGIWKYHLLVETDTLGQNRIDEYPTTSSYNTPSSQALDAGGAGYDWELWAYDIAGNVSSGTGEKRFYIDDPPDTTRPSSPGAPDLRASSDSGSSNTDNITNDSTPTFDWSAATDNKGVTGYEYRINGGSWVDRGNNLNVTLPAQANGVRMLEVRAYDAAGNRSLTPSSLAFTVDTVAPNVPSIIYPSVDERILDTTPAFDWSGSDNSGGSGIWKYHLLVETDTLGVNKIDEYPISSSYNTPSSQALDAGDAGYDWELWAYDIAGNVSSGTGEKRFYVISESFLSAFWLTPLDVSDGDYLTMCAEVEAIAVGELCTFEIFEDDGLLQDDAVVPTLTGDVYVGEEGRTYVRATWVAEWQDDQFGGDPEFYFEVSYGDVSLKSSKSLDEESRVRKRMEPSTMHGDFYYDPVDAPAGPATANLPLTDDRIPIILVHGMSGDAKVNSLNYWYGWANSDASKDPVGLFNDTEMDDYFRVYRYVYDSRRPIAENGAEFASFVNQFYAENTNMAERQVVIMAHSMGGLVSRYALNTSSDFRAKVHRLVTLGTPHLGSPGANPSWIFWDNFTDSSITYPFGILSQYELLVLKLGFPGTAGAFDLAWYNVDDIPLGARTGPNLFAAHQLYDESLLDSSIASPFCGSPEMLSEIGDSKIVAFGGYFSFLINGMGPTWADNVSEEVYTDHIGLAAAEGVLNDMPMTGFRVVGNNDGLVPITSALLGSAHMGAEKINLKDDSGHSLDHASYLDVASTMDYVKKRLMTMIRVEIAPQSAIDAGARWRIAGGTWQKSGVSLNALKPGQYTIEFKDVSGWTKPTNQTVTVNEDDPEILSGAGATYSIINPPAGTLQFKSSTYSVNENGGYVRIYMSRKGGSFGAANVSFATANGSAIAGSDYVSKSGTLTWSNGDASDKPIDVYITDDSFAENAETFTVNLSSASGVSLGNPSTTTVTINGPNDQPAGTLQFKSSTYTVNEDDGSIRTYVSRTGGSFGAASVNFATANGSATAGSDYSANTGTLNWTNGDTADKPIDISITDDSEPEDAETFVVNLSGASGASLGSPSTTTVTINGPNDQPIPVLARSPASLAPSCKGGQNAASQSFEVWNAGGGSINYSVTDSAAWISITPSGGTTVGIAHDSLQVDYNTSGLSNGQHNATITINAPGVSGSPQTIAVTLTVLPSSVPIHYVDINGGNPIAPYSSWATAATNIQDAVDTASSSNTVLVTNGTYLLTSEIVIDKDILIQSVNGPDKTIVDGGGSVRCFNLGTNECVLSGFTITNGYATTGGGVLAANYSPIVSNCFFNGNLATWFGGGMEYGTAYNCVFEENAAHNLSGGGAMYHGIAYNCLFVRNGWANAYGAGALESGFAYNCTFYQNIGELSGAVGNATVYNCIFAENICVVDPEQRDLYGDAYNSCLETATHGVDGNITNAPLFIDTFGGNFRLQSNSPCINWGNNSYTNSLVDLDGSNRVVEGYVDMGCYEYQGYLGLDDSDGDGLLDKWERMHFGGNADPNLDDDGDGHSNGEEQIADTLPMDAGSFFSITSYGPTDSFVLEWEPSATGRYYNVMWSTNLLNGFKSLARDLQYPQNSYTDLVHSAWPQAFYKVGVGMEPAQVSVPEGMVEIPGGTNTGTDPDFGTYSLTVASFYMDRTEITKAQWDTVYDWAIAHGYTFNHRGLGKAPNHPVHTVNWYDCVKWCNARSEMDGRVPCYTEDGMVFKTGEGQPSCDFNSNGYRLPTSEEWEYAARGGLSGQRFPWGNQSSHLLANYYSTGGFTYDLNGYAGYHPGYFYGDKPYTSPAGSFNPNGYGLFDMAGNVREWCWWPETLAYARVAGGSWDYYASHLRCGHYTQAQPEGTPWNAVGFRSISRAN